MIVVSAKMPNKFNFVFLTLVIAIESTLVQNNVPENTLGRMNGTYNTVERLEFEQSKVCYPCINMKL